MRYAGAGSLTGNHYAMIARAGSRAYSLSSSMRQNSAMQDFRKHSAALDTKQSQNIVTTKGPQPGGSSSLAL